jgi:hypothetical protein
MRLSYLTLQVSHVDKQMQIQKRFRRNPCRGQNRTYPKRQDEESVTGPQGNQPLDTNIGLLMYGQTNYPCAQAVLKILTLGLSLLTHSSG